MGIFSKNIIILIFSLFVSNACSYPWGLYTSRIDGQIQADEGDGFVVVIFWERSFVEVAQRPLLIKKSLLLHPDSRKHYTFTPPAALVRADFHIIFSNHSMAYHSFNQTLGRGRLKFDTELVVAENWQDSYYFSIKPFLSALVSDDGYKLPEHQKTFILEWLVKVENEFKDEKDPQ